MSSADTTQTTPPDGKASRQAPTHVANDGSETSPDAGHEAGGGSDDTGPGPNGS